MQPRNPCQQSDCQGMILAAGLGQRLAPLTLLRAKPALPFLNRPLIRYSLDLFQGAGIGDLFVNLHHLPHTVAEALRGCPFSVHFSHEEVILGTAGGIGMIRRRMTAEHLAVSNGKIYFEEDLGSVLQAHRESGAWATLVVAPWQGDDRYNPVFLDAGGNLTSFGQPLPGRGDQRPHVYTGVQILGKEALKLIPEGVSDSVRDLYPRMVREGRPVKGFVSRACWHECSWPESYLRNSLQVLKRRGLGNLGPTGQADCRGAIVGEGSGLGRGCRVRDSILWEGVSLGSGSRLNGCIVTSSVDLPSGTDLEGVIVTPVDDTAGARLEPLGRIENNWIWPIHRS